MSLIDTQIDTQAARKAMEGAEFREFMKTEIKITNEDDIKKLGGCGSCWNNAGFTPRTIKKINERLKKMSDAGKLKPETKVYSKWFKDKESAIEYIRDIEENGVLGYFAGFKK